MKSHGSRILCGLCALCGEMLISSSTVPSSSLLPPPLPFTPPGCPSRSAPSALVVRGLAGAFRLFWRALGAKWGWMLGWVVAIVGLQSMTLDFAMLKGFLLLLNSESHLMNSYHCHSNIKRNNFSRSVLIMR